MGHLGKFKAFVLIFSTFMVLIPQTWEKPHFHIHELQKSYAWDCQVPAQLLVLRTEKSESQNLPLQGIRMMVNTTAVGTPHLFDLTLSKGISLAHCLHITIHR